MKWKPYQFNRASLDDVKSWWTRYSNPGFAMVTGTISGIVVLDFDGEEGEELRRSLGLKPSVRTPTGGSHVYVAQPGFPIRTIPRPDAEHFPGLDVKAEGGIAGFYGETPQGRYRTLKSHPVYEL